jgi:hypothetical protein
MRRTTAAQISSVMLASFQLFAQGKESPMEHATLYRMTQIDGLLYFLYKSRAKRRANDTVAPRTSVFVADVRAALPIAFTLSRPIILGSDTVIGRTQRNFRTRSIASPKL